MRSLTMLNEAGDTTISWTEDRDSEMEAIIQKKMDEGVTFFIVERVDRGEAVMTKLNVPGDARRTRALLIPDEDLQKFVEAGNAGVAPTPDAPIKKSRVSRDAKEVAKSDSVGVKPRRGG
jgi:hypothetical protein